MLLSEAYNHYPAPETRYACCLRCKTAWEDDMQRHGTLFCPKCGPNYGALYRVVSTPRDMQCTLDGEEPVERADG